MLEWLSENFSLWQPIVLLFLTVVLKMSKSVAELGSGFTTWGDTMAETTKTLDERLKSMEQSWAQDMSVLSGQISGLKDEVHREGRATERRLARLEGANGIGIAKASGDQ